MLSLLFCLSLGVNPHLPMPDRVGPNHVSVNVPVERALGGVLTLFIRPGMNEGQVRKLLGESELTCVSGWMTVWCYRELGVQVFWSTPVWVIAPSERIGPEGMALLQAAPCWWMGAIVVPLLSAEYSPRAVLKEISWVGFR
jgi:hypothetical protein